MSLFQAKPTRQQMSVGRITTFQVKKKKSNPHYNFVCKFSLKKHGRPVDLRHDIPQTIVTVYAYRPGDPESEFRLYELPFISFNSSKGLNKFSLRVRPDKKRIAGMRFRCKVEWQLG
jgi:hypothetical protein